jgi:predicted nucleotidyltransferase
MATPERRESNKTMARDWESWLATASGPASPTEEEDRDRTEARIRDAIRASSELPASSVRIYVKGSYANNTNVRRDSDVDIAVEWTETIKVAKAFGAKDATPEQLGYTPVPFTVEPAELRARVERALREAFGYIDTSGDKAIKVPAGSTTLDADVVPCFAVDRYDSPLPKLVYHRGSRLYPKSGGWIDNFPDQQLANGNAKNRATERRYKQIIRCIKRLENEMVEDGIIPRSIPGYLIECLVYNVPNDRFGHTRRLEDMRAVFSFLWNGLRDEDVYREWEQVDGLRYLFRGTPMRPVDEVYAFIDKAWDTIGVE